MNLFDFLSSPLKRQIELYCSWKGIRYPVAAHIHREVLMAFTKHVKGSCAKDITYEQIQEYSSSFPSSFHQRQALHVIRQFLRYWYDMGLLKEDLARFVKTDTIPVMKTGRPVHVKCAKRVQELRQEGKSWRLVKLTMETEDQRSYDIKSLYRWSKYDLKQLST